MLFCSYHWASRIVVITSHCWAINVELIAFQREKGGSVCTSFSMAPLLQQLWSGTYSTSSLENISCILCTMEKHLEPVSSQFCPLFSIMDPGSHLNELWTWFKHCQNWLTEVGGLLTYSSSYLNTFSAYDLPAYAREYSWLKVTKTCYKMFERIWRKTKC